MHFAIFPVCHLPRLIYLVLAKVEFLAITNAVLPSFQRHRGGKTSGQGTRLPSICFQFLESNSGAFAERLDMLERVL